MLIRLGAVTAIAVTAMAQGNALDYFEKKIRPVLAARCYACHSSTTGSPQGGLRLDSTAGIRQGGNSGLAVRAGDPDQSLLLRAIRRTDKNLKMPPGEPLSADIISDFEHWIRDGATMPGDRSLPAAKQRALWSLEKPRSVPLPQVRNG